MGAPVTPSLLGYGPRHFRNEGAPLNPESELTAAQLNLWKWQLAGAGITAVKALVLVAATGDLMAAGAMWNPTGDVSLHPTVTRTALGVYEVEWATQYEDETGTLQDVTILAAKVSPQGGAFRVGYSTITGTTITVNIVEGVSGADEDGAFLLEVL